MVEAALSPGLPNMTELPEVATTKALSSVGAP